MEIAFKEIEELATNILPEFMETFHKIRAENPKWSKIKIFKALFKIGEKKHSSLNEVQDAEFLELFTGFLSKTNMEYSSFLAYGAGCVKGMYGVTISRQDFLELMKPLAKVSKENFGH
jgi:hypothetical protein